MRRLSILTVLTCTLAALWPARPALALLGLNVWPSKFELQVAPGGQKTGVIAVQNQSMSKMRLQVLILNCRMNEAGAMTYVDGDDPYGCRAWLKTSAQEFEVNPRTNYQLLYSIRVPKDAAGSYIAAILLADAARQLTPNEYQDLQGTIVLQTVPGSGVKAADLLGLALQKSTADANFAAVLTMQNRGNLALTPSGQLQLFAEDGSEKLNAPINEGKEMVLPGSTRRLLVPLENLEAGSYKVTATVDYGSLELLQGETTVFIKSGEIIYQKGADKTPRGIPTPAAAASDQQPPVKGKPVKPGAAGAKLGKGDIDQLVKTGTALYSSGEYAKSLAVWQKILKIDPRNAAAKKNMERTNQKLKAQKNAKG